MGRAFGFLLRLSTALVLLTIAAGLVALSFIRSASGLGTVGMLVFIIVALPTLVCILLTLGIWLFKSNRS